MLTWLRDNAKIFLIATIVIFVALIFLRWGMGEGSSGPQNPYQRPIATVDGKDILPGEYQEVLGNLSQTYRQMMEQSGNPDSEAMLMLMGATIAEDAFVGLIDRRLHGNFLQRRNWNDFTIGQAEALLKAQVSMQDLGDMSPEEYLKMVRSEQPGLYQQYLYQTWGNANSLRFSFAAGMMSMASKEEVDYLLLDTQGQITARYIIIDTIPPVPDMDMMETYYFENPDAFIRQAGSLLRYVTVQITPREEDLQLAMQRLDSLTYATPGSPIAATRSQLASMYGDSLVLESGTRTEPLLSLYTANPSISSFHALLLDSISSTPVSTESSLILEDTLYMRRWEVPVLPQYSTIRSVMWALEDQMETILATSIPQIGDSLSIVDFGEMLVEENTNLSGSVTDELVIFAVDTLWPDSFGPLFYSPSYRGGYPSFTVVLRLEFFPHDTVGFDEAINTGYLQEKVMFSLRRDASRETALNAIEDIRLRNINLGAWAEAESLTVYTTPVFTPSQVRMNAAADPDAISGILSSEEFSITALVAPEFQVIGPFSTGASCVIAEILSRQVPPENPNFTTVMYVATQTGHEQLGEINITEFLRETSEIRDLREEWEEYAQVVEDSLRTEREQEEEL